MRTGNGARGMAGWIRWWTLALAVAATACDQQEQFRTYCARDADCPPGYRCNPDTGLCVCATDEVCRPDEYCAPDGQCKPRMSCDTNLDCPEGTYCDTTTGNCIELDKCTRDDQCPPGYICSETYFRCVRGCRDTGDCMLGDVCLEGECVSDRCEDKTFCDYGQLCDLDSGTCVDDDRGPYCEPCKPGSIADPYRCGPGPNFCVMTNNDPGREPFCGVDCSQGQECPNGYGCHLILMSPEGACRSDDDCQSGECHINEGDEVGFCLCTRDDQCPQDSCDQTTMQCRITRRPCTPGGGECDRPIYCIDGLCLIGRNCTPVEGLDCSDFGN